MQSHNIMAKEKKYTVQCARLLAGARGSELDVQQGKTITLPADQAAPLVTLGSLVPANEDHDTSSTDGDIIKAIASLDPATADLWTTDGRPQVSAIVETLGRPIGARERNRAWAEYQDVQDAAENANGAEAGPEKGKGDKKS